MMFLDVKATYGAAGNGTTDDRTAFSNADAAGGTIYVPAGTYRISATGGSTFTIASDVRFQQGAVLKPDANVTIELTGRADAGLFKIFDVANTGSKVYPRREAQVAPQWWGATGNGTTDDRTAFYNAGLVAGTLYLPAGTYKISSNLTMTSDIRFQQGAKLKPDAGVTIELEGSVDAGLSQIFDVSASGSRVYPRRETEVVPQWWGARGDWKTNDYPAIAAALDAVRMYAAGSNGTGATVFFPKGIYRVETSLNCTLGWYHLKGAGPGISILRGDTGPGAAVIEFLGSEFCTVEGLQIDSTGVVRNPPVTPPTGTPTPNPSTVGVLLGRVMVAGLNGPEPGQSWFVNLRDCLIEMHTAMTANGGRGTVGVYNYGCEISDLNNLCVIADTPVLYTSHKEPGFTLTSYHRPPTNANPMSTDPTSMTVVTATGANGFFALGGPALRVDGAANVHVFAHLSSRGSYKAAVEVAGMLTDFEHRGTIEVFPTMLEAMTNIRGARLYGVMMNYDPNYPLIHLTKDTVHTPPASLPQIFDSILHIIPGPDAYGGSPPLVDQVYAIDTDASWPGMVDGSLIFLNRGKVRIANAFTGSGFNGNLVLSDQDLANLSITSGSRTGNVVKAADGFEVDGPKLGLATTATGSTLGTVVRKVQVYDAAGNSLGYVAIYNSIT